MKTSLLLLFVATLSAPVNAEGFLGKLKTGTGKVGDVAKKGVDAVHDTVESTTELVSDEETPDATRAKLDNMANDVLARLLAENSEVAQAYEINEGYAVFDMRRISVFPLSTGYGRGVAVADGARTYMQMGTGGVGAAFGIGGFESLFVILLETPADFERFVENGYDASADAGKMEGTERATTKVQFTDGRSFLC